jgi:hypothetical protein
MLRNWWNDPSNIQLRTLIIKVLNLPSGGPWPLFRFLDLFTQSVGLLPVARPLPAHTTAQTQNKHAHYRQWDSNPRSQCLSGAKTVHAIAIGEPLSLPEIIWRLVSYICRWWYMGTIPADEAAGAWSWPFASIYCRGWECSYTPISHSIKCGDNFTFMWQWCWFLRIQKSRSIVLES